MSATGRQPKFKPSHYRTSIPFKACRGDDVFPFDGFGRDHALGGVRAGADDAEAGLFQATAQIGVLQGGQHLRVERRDDGHGRADRDNLSNRHCWLIE